MKLTKFVDKALMNNFRRVHICRVLDEFDKELLQIPPKNTPLDLYLRKYFLSHKSVGSKDREVIADNIYNMVRYKALLDVFSRKPINWHSRFDTYLNENLEQLKNNESLPPYVRCSFPKTLYELLVDSYGNSKAYELCNILNEKAPLTVRVNTLKTSRDEIFNRWNKQGFEVSPCEHSPNGIKFVTRPKTNLFEMEEFNKGLFEVQDEGSQLVSMRIECKPGDHVVDYCGGSGGKALAFGPRQIYLHDIRKSVLIQAKNRINRAGLQNIQFHSDKDKLRKLLKGKADWLLLDVPCTGTGTIRRNPDIKWKFSVDMQEHLLKVQRRIFEESLPLIRKDGKIVYTTCSILPQENMMQVKYFCEQYGLEVKDGTHFQSMPMSKGMDGFFSATLVKKM